MNQRRIRERGPVGRVLQAPQDACAQQLLADVWKLTVAAGEA